MSERTYDAERTNINGRWYRYRTDVFYDVHHVIASFNHRTEIGGYLITAIRVKIHKLINTQRQPNE